MCFFPPSSSHILSTYSCTSSLSWCLVSSDFQLASKGQVPCNIHELWHLWQDRDPSDDPGASHIEGSGEYQTPLLTILQECSAWRLKLKDIPVLVIGPNSKYSSYEEECQNDSWLFIQLVMPVAVLFFGWFYPVSFSSDLTTASTGASIFLAMSKCEFHAHKLCLYKINNTPEEKLDWTLLACARINS